MFKNKKLFYSFGTAAFVITPVIAVVSCGTNNAIVREHSITQKDVDAYNNELTSWKADWANEDWVEDAIINLYVAPSIFKFKDLSTVKSISGKSFYLPSFITAIGDFAFMYATLPADFAAPKNLLSVGQESFKGVDFSKMDQTKVFGEHTWMIDSGAFSGCVFGENFKVPATITTIKESAFSSTTYGAGFEFNATITSLPDAIFNGASFASPLEFKQSLTDIGQSSLGGIKFKIYTGDKNGLVLPNTIYAIGTSAFAGSTFDFRFIVPRETEVIGTQAFSGATFKNGIDIDVNLEKTKESLFASAVIERGSLVPADQKTIKFSDKTTVFAEKTFFGAKLPEDFALPSKFVAMEKQCFVGTNIANKDIFKDVDSTITSIGEHSFQDAKLPKGLILPSNANSFNEENLAYAFDLAIIPYDAEWTGPTAADTFNKPLPGATLTPIQP